MKRSHEIASHVTSSSVLKANFLRSPIDNLVCMHSRPLKFQLDKIGDKPSIGRGKEKREGCDLFITANATVESQSNFNLQVSLV